MSIPPLDTHYMKMAFAMGRRAMGQVWPNPAVGCVLIKNGRVIGRAHTHAGGRPHAETQALAMAKVRFGENAAKGATAYVTLEPCAHQGQTPPCAAALKKAGIARCVVALRDPDPRVSGKGIQMMRAAGITVDVGCCAPEAAQDHKGFLMRLAQGRPRVTLKLATTLDGRIALSNGQSQWITGPQARQRVQADRASHDAVMVGAGTVRADNPRLTVRGMGARSQPVRIVVSSKMDFEAPALLEPQDKRGVIFTHKDDGEEFTMKKLQFGSGTVTLLAVKPSAQGLDMDDLLCKLGNHGLTSVYCEGGGKLAASLLSAGLVDDLILYSAGKIIGADGRSSIAALGIDDLKDALRFELISHDRIGDDLRCHYRTGHFQPV